MKRKYYFRNHFINVELGKKPIARYENDYGMPPCEEEKMKKVTTREQLSSKLSCNTFMKLFLTESYNSGIFPFRKENRNRQSI